MTGKVVLQLDPGKWALTSASDITFIFVVILCKTKHQSGVYVAEYTRFHKESQLSHKTSSFHRCSLSVLPYHATNGFHNVINI